MYKRWLIPLAILAILFIAADVWVYLYDSGKSPEILRGGMQFHAIEFSQGNASANLSFPDRGHYLLFRCVCDSASGEALEEARAGIPGTLTVTRMRNQQTWTIPFLLTITEEGIQRHTAVVGTTASGLSAAMGLGTSYRLDYLIDPTSSGETTYQDLFQSSFAKGEKIQLSLELQSPPGPNTRLFVAFSRYPRYLHQILF